MAMSMTMVDGNWLWQVVFCASACSSCLVYSVVFIYKIMIKSYGFCTFLLFFYFIYFCIVHCRCCGNEVEGIVEGRRRRQVNNDDNGTTTQFWQTARQILIKESNKKREMWDKSNMNLPEVGRVRRWMRFQFELYGQQEHTQLRHSSRQSNEKDN